MLLSVINPKNNQQISAELYKHKVLSRSHVDVRSIFSSFATNDQPSKRMRCYKCLFSYLKKKE